MAIESLSILTGTSTGKAYLAQEYGKVVGNIQKGVIFEDLKNKDLSGSPTAGSVIARRIANTQVEDYGTEGKAIKGLDVEIPINNHKQFLEKVEDADVHMYGVEGLLNNRLESITKSVIRHLDREFLNVIKTEGTAVTASAGATTLAKKVDELIVSLETTNNDFVDGVDREEMTILLSSKAYTDLQSDIDIIPNMANGNTYQMFHGVRIKQTNRLPATVDIAIMANGAIALPFRFTPDEMGKYPATNRWHLGAFIDYGAKAVSPELIKYIATTTTVTPPTTGGEDSGKS